MTVNEYIDVLVKMDSHDIVKSDIDCGQAYTYLDLPKWFETESDGVDMCIREEIEAEYLYILSRGDTPTKEQLLKVI